MIGLALLLRREIMIFKYQWLRIVSFFIAFPMIIFLCITMPLYEVISLPILNYLHWSIAGILIVSSSFVCLNHSIKSILLLKDSDKHYQIYLKSPISIFKIVLGVYVISIIYGMIQFFFGSILLVIINQGAFSILQWILIFVQIVSFLILIGSIGLLIGFLVSNGEIVTYINITVFLIISFAFGALLPIELFPEGLSIYLKNIPMVVIIMNTQRILYLESPFYFGMVLNIVIAVLVYFFTVILAYKKLRK